MMLPAVLTAYGCEPAEAALLREAALPSDLTVKIIPEPVSEKNAPLAEGSRCVSVSHKSQVTEPILKALRQAGVVYVSSRSIGCDHIDLKAAEQIGIAIDNVSYSADSVADFALMLMLMAVRNAKTITRRSDQRDYRLEAVRAKELRDMTVGVIGTGHIGRAVIRRLRGFGCRILTFDCQPDSPEIPVSLETLLKESDMITLHIPLTAETYHFLDGPRIGQMKRSALIINTGRGALIDTEALIRALENKRIAGAALDVLEGEEGIFYTDCRNQAIENKPLLRLQAMPNVLITPHTAYYTDHALRDTIEQTVEKCLEYERSINNGQTENRRFVRRLLGRA